MMVFEEPTVEIIWLNQGEIVFMSGETGKNCVEDGKSYALEYCEGYDVMDVDDCSFSVV